MLNILKVDFFDRRLLSRFFLVLSVIGTIFSIFSIFLDIPSSCKKTAGCVIFVVLLIVYFFLWLWMNNKKAMSLKIGNTTVSITSGDIFAQEGFKVIAFNEYFDTIVGDIVSENTLNGIFIKKNVSDFANLDKQIASDDHLMHRRTDINNTRKAGNKQKYKLGSIFKYSNDYLLAAFAKFNEDNEANIAIPDYMHFLLDFWHEISVFYNSRLVSITIFGSGITRFVDRYNPSNQELLELILWSFRVSGVKLISGLQIIIPVEKCAGIDFYRLKELEYGV
jgi:hypothetical protein